MWRISLLVLAVSLTTISGQTTEYSYNYTVTYNPGRECLPYDGSVVPDCSKYVDPVTKQPYYHEHSSNCSRFWECGPNYETCLFECANCQHSENENPQCAGQWALTFDVRYQFPVGPVCDWPSAIDCTLTCPETAQCQENSDCNDCGGGYCNVDCTCTYPNPCSCSSDQDCDNFDGMCDLPSPHHPEYCAYCDAGLCKGGCIDSDNCPDGYECNNHLCEAAACVEDTECPGYNVICNENNDNCYYCGGNCGSNDGCCPGCHDSDLNCQYPTPICDGSSHICGCWNDTDCNAGDFCNHDNNSCEPLPDECQTDADCNVGLSGVCDTDQETGETIECKYCESNGLYNVCKPGCKYDSDSTEIPRCPADQEYCNIDSHNCQANPGYTLLTKIVFTSDGCDGCTKEGVNMTLVGTPLAIPEPRCKTVDLDHPNEVDYVTKSTFLANGAEQNLGWENCWQGPLDGYIQESTVVWTGEGTWKPKSICYDWDKEANRVFICTFPDGTALTNGQEAVGSCSISDGTDCP